MREKVFTVGNITAAAGPSCGWGVGVGCRYSSSATHVVWEKKIASDRQEIQLSLREIRTVTIYYSPCFYYFFSDCGSGNAYCPVSSSLDSTKVVGVLSKRTLSICRGPWLCCESVEVVVVLKMLKTVSCPNGRNDDVEKFSSEGLPLTWKSKMNGSDDWPGSIGGFSGLLMTT